MLSRLTLATFCVWFSSLAAVAKEPSDNIYPTSDSGGGLKLRLVCGDRATDARLAKLKDYPAIEVLQLFGSADFSDRGLENLKALPKLRSLSLGGLHLTAAGLENVRGNQTLKTLHLSEMSLTKPVAELIASLTNLETLRVYSESVEPGSWQLIAKLPNLRDLHVQNYLASATPAELEGVEDFTELRTLGLFSSGFGSESVARFAANKHLRELTLSRVHVNDDAGAAISKFTELKKLTLTQTSATPGALKALQEIPALRHFHINSEEVNDADLVLYKPFYRLHTLEFTSQRLTEATTHELRGELHNTVVNRFRWKQNLRDLQAMSREVETNDVGNVIAVEMLCHERATDAKLNILQQFPTIERLVAMGPNELTDDGVSELHALKNLRDLTLYSYLVTDAGLKHLGNNNPGLQKIHLRTRAVTPAGIAWLKEKLPDAKITRAD